MENEAILLAVERKSSTISIWTRHGLRALGSSAYVKAELAEERVVQYWADELRRAQELMGRAAGTDTVFIVLPVERRHAG